MDVQGARDEKGSAEEIPDDLKNFIRNLDKLVNRRQHADVIGALKKLLDIINKFEDTTPNDDAFDVLKELFLSLYEQGFTTGVNAAVLAKSRGLNLSVKQVDDGDPGIKPTKVVDE